MRKSLSMRFIKNAALYLQYYHRHFELCGTDKSCFRMRYRILPHNMCFKEKKSANVSAPCAR